MSISYQTDQSCLKKCSITKNKFKRHLATTSYARASCVTHSYNSVLSTISPHSSTLYHEVNNASRSISRSPKFNSPMLQATRMPGEMVTISLLLDLRSSKFCINDDTKNDSGSFEIHAHEVTFSKSSFANLHAAYSNISPSISTHSLLARRTWSMASSSLKRSSALPPTPPPLLIQGFPQQDLSQEDVQRKL
jgi:hypothetical protein